MAHVTAAVASFQLFDELICDHCGSYVHTTGEHEEAWEREAAEAWEEHALAAWELWANEPANESDFDDEPEAEPRSRVVDHPTKLRWLAGVERETEEHREARATGLERVGRRKKNAARLDGLSEREAQRRALWYTSRAKGQRERFESVRGCQQRVTMQVLCTECGSVAEQGARCRIGILCVSCRGKILQRQRMRFARARRAVLERARHRNLFSPFRLGGYYSEKLLTLTIPHLPEHDVSARIRFVLAAWPHFLKRMNAYLRERDAEHVEWLRHWEWTSGDDGQGHPHMHVWFFGPFLPHKREDDRITAWWREALVRAGFPPARLDWLVVDLRSVVNGGVDEGDGIVTEVCKYVTKDMIAPGLPVPPEVYGRVYEELDGRRPLQASRGFMALGDGETCCPECQATRSFLVRVKAKDAETWSAWKGCPEAQRRWAERQASEVRLL